MANIERHALLQSVCGLTELFQHTLSVCSKLLERGLITKDTHDWVLTAQGGSNKEKAARVVSCLADRIKDAAQMFHDFIDLLKEDPYFADVMEKISTEYSMSLSLCKILYSINVSQSQEPYLSWTSLVTATHLMMKKVSIMILNIGGVHCVLLL